MEPALRKHKAQPPFLYDEIIFEILSWLPVKSLLQLRTVCKSWKSFISDPSFVKLHLQRSSRNVNIILQSQLNRQYIFAQPCEARSLFDNPSSIVISQHPSFRLNFAKYDFLGSCNGLLCVFGTDYSYEDKVKQIWVRFWNPATRLRSQKSPRLLVCLTTMFLFGFGYHDSTNTYRVVVVLCDHYAKSTQVKVYSMGDNCWRNIQPLPVVPVLLKKNGVNLNGTLNWLVFCNDNPGKELVIVSLDMEKETSTQLLLPHLTLELKYLFFGVLGVLRDRLCISYDYNGSHFVIWQMMEFGVPNSWIQSVKVSYQDIGIDHKLLVSLLLPLHMYENGDILMTLRYGLKLHAIMYKGSRVERPKISKRIEWLSLYDVVHVESLVSPL